MGATRKTRSRRARRILSGILAGVLTLGGATALSLSQASPAAAVPVAFTSPAPGAIIGTTVIEFEGVADPNEPVRVDPDTNGLICDTTADALGNWQCFVTFIHSGALIGIQALGLTSGTFANINITVSLQPVITPTPSTPGFVYSNVDPPSVSGTTEPLATINGTIGGQPCNAAANGAGAFTCTALAGLGADGNYAIALNSTPTATGVASSFNDPISYHLDTVAPPIPDSTFPFDSNVFPANIATTDSTPLIGGNPGTADALGTVTVVADDFGLAPPAHLNGGAGTFYCSGVVASDGSWSCNGPPITLNHYWEFSLFQRDLAGNLSASPDDEFAIRLLPPPPAPTVLLPVIGYQSVLKRVHVSTVNLAEGTMYVREGGVDRCAPTPVAIPTFSCDTVPLSVGVHHLNIFQEDQYGTFTAAVQRTVTILAPPLPPVPKILTFTFRIIGPDGPVGEEGLSAGDVVTIVADGLPIGTIISAEIHSTPISLGSTTVGPTGSLALPVTVPAVDAGAHEIVLAASAPGYEPASATSPVQVRDVKQIPDDTEEVKQLGDPAPEATDVPGDHGAGPGPGGGNGIEDPTVFGSSVVSPFVDHSFHLTPAGIVLSGSIAVGFLLLVGFPAELLESTIRSNYDRAFGWLARLRRRGRKLVEPIARALSHPWIGSSITVLVAALLLGFADPGFGFNGASVRLTLAMILAVVAINIGLNLIVMRVASRAFDVAALLRPMPAALAIVAISVLVSRLAGISPGFLFGVVLGIAYARELKLRDEARLGVLGVGLTIGAGLLAWLGYGLASAAASGPGFWNNLLIETLAAITLEALGTLVIALLPIEFLDGRTIFRWSKPAWLGLYAVTLLVFLFVVVPLSDNWGTETAPIFGWGTLFAVFAVVAIVTWAIFRRLNGATPSSPEAAARRQRSRR
jgi:hypothetical protein